MLIAYVAEHSSQTALALEDATDQAAVGAALRAAAAKILQIRHPDEPDEPLPNWCDVVDEDGVPVLHLDMKDEIRYSALVVRIVLDELTRAGIDGRLVPWQRPPVPVPSDLGPEPSAPAYPVAGHEAVTALNAVAQLLDRLMREAAGQRPRPAAIADRFAAVLGRLDPRTLTVIRHVCLTMVSNLIASGRRPRPDGLTVLADMDGHLYAADLRAAAQAVVDADLFLAFETGATIVQAGPMVVSALPGAGRLFDGLDEPQLTTTRDACRRIVEPDPR